jgi:hypothetical protein
MEGMLNNRYYNLLLYAKNEGIIQCTCRLLYNAQILFEKSLYTESIKRDIQLIRKKHGFTKEQWKKVLSFSTCFYFYEEEGVKECNDEIKSFIKQKLGLLPTQVMDSYSVFSGGLSNMFLRGRNFKYGIKRLKKDGIFHYTI